MKLMMPLEVSDWEMALGPKCPERYLPTMTEIPVEFSRRYNNPWIELATMWFYHGLPPETTFQHDPSFEHHLAIRHITAALKCKLPKKDLFMAIGYLLSSWYELVTIPGVKTYGGH